MPLSALPERLQTVEAWKGTDHDTALFRWFIPIKLKYLTAGPRVPSGWFKWRDVPFTVFALWGGGPLRIESSDGHRQDKADLVVRRAWNVRMLEYYMTRCQYWARWHFAIQWPLQISFHFYRSANDVPVFPYRPETLGIKKLLFGYGPTHRDSDRVYWLGSFYLGGQWK